MIARLPTFLLLLSPLLSAAASSPIDLVTENGLPPSSASLLSHPVSSSHTQTTVQRSPLLLSVSSDSHPFPSFLHSPQQLPDSLLSARSAWRLQLHVDFVSHAPGLSSTRMRWLELDWSKKSSASSSDGLAGAAIAGGLAFGGAGIDCAAPGLDCGAAQIFAACPTLCRAK